MTGESQRDDNDDFLDDDFVIEDMAPKNEDLDSLFEVPAGDAAAADVDPAAPADPDEEDMLFEASSVADQSETFASGPEFAEASEGTWDGELLDLESEAVASGPVSSEAMAEAEQSFTKELDSLLQSDEDFALDSEQELEVIGGSASDDDGGADDGISEFEQSGPFVLDDGDGAWQEDATAEPVADADEEELTGAGMAAAAFGAVDADADAELADGAEDGFGMPLDSDEAETHEPGWEPLPSTHVDDLSEVDEVERADGDEEYDPVYGEPEAAEHDGELVGAGIGGGLAADVEGHDLYVDEEQGATVRGALDRRGRGFRVLMSLAATLMVLFAGAAVVLRPEWFGLSLKPEKIEQAELPRPTVALAVPTPAPAVVEPTPVEPTPVEPTPVEATPVEPPAPTVVVEEPPVVAPEVPVAQEPPPVEPAPVEPAPTEPTRVVEAPTPDLPGWPVAQATPESQAGPDGGSRPSRLVRIGEELLIGDTEELGPRGSLQGVVPGSRAFAQLQNGNYFIGNVKRADSQRITLNVDNGEVTIPVAAIARLTELGSQDYDELQRATSGFVRLTNNNRLVGGILSSVADDHIVLEFRKNRVMLPKSLVGQVVRGEGDAEIRLDTTTEEDDWLKRLVERQLGTGTGAELPATPQGTQPPR